MISKKILLVVLSVLVSTTNLATAVSVPAQLPAETMPTAPVRIALVLGGGGVRSFAALGVIKELEKKQIPIDLIVGTSMGSIIGSLYANDPNINILIDKLLSAKQKELTKISLFGTGGVDDGHQMELFLDKHLDNKEFHQLKIKFVSVTTDMATGRPFAIASGPIAPAVHASAALPPVFKPVKIYEHILADGGASDVVPVDIAKRYHPEIIIAVNVVQNPGNEMTESHMLGIAKRYNLLRNRNFADDEAALADVDITPNVGMTGTFDESARPAMIKAGEEAAIQAMPEIEKLMQERHISILANPK